MKRITLLLTLLMLAACAGDGTGVFGGGNTAPDTQTDDDGLPLDVVGVESSTDGDTAPAPNQSTESATVDTSVVETTPPPPADDPPPPAPEPPVVETPTPPPPATDTAAGDGRLGTTVASIGAADEPGFWIKTPLVSSQSSGRLFYPASGRTVQVQLIPSGGAAGSGSEVSLAALRLLDAPLDGLPELVVYEN